MSQGSHDPDHETLGSAYQGELENTLSGLAPTAQDPDEDEAYTPTQYEERSWDTFEQNPLRSMYGLADDNTNSSSNNNSTNGFIHQEKFVGRLPVQLNVPTCRYNSIGARTHQVNIPCVTSSRFI